MAYNDLREGITGQRKRLVLGDCLFLRSQGIGGLNVCLLSSGGCNEVDFPCPLRNLTFGILFIAVDDSDVNGAFTDQEFIVDDIMLSAHLDDDKLDNIFHDMSHLLLTKSYTGVSQPHILTVEFVRIVKIAFAFHIPALALGKQKGIREMIQISFHCI